MSNATQNLTPRSSWAPPQSLTTATDRTNVFFVGFPCFAFGTFAPPIFAASGNCVTAVISDTYSKDYSHIPIAGVQVPIVTMAEFRAFAKKAPAEVVHFFERRDDFWSFETLKSAGASVRVTDFVEKLAELKLQHTYLTVDQERDWWMSQPAERIQRMSNLLGDQRSKDVLAARIAAYIQMDRRPLMENSMSLYYEYFNSISTHQSFVPSDDEYYVDVGAAHGDTVDKFVLVSAGKFARIDAFEPTPGQFAELSKRATADKRITTRQLAVGARSGSIKFFDNLSNPFGGNALSINNGEKTIDVKCVALDEIMEKCTLLKMDVEGYECQVLEGARRLIETNKPNMAVTCYHYPNDLFDILELVATIHPYRYVALRHYGPNLFDSILFFSDRQSFE